MFLKVVFFFILKNELNFELYVVLMYLFELFEIFKKYVRKWEIEV